MRSLYYVFRREFGVLFTSPLAYVLFVLFLIISGVFFSAGLGTYVQYSIIIQMQRQMQMMGGGQLPPFTDMVFGNFFRNTIVIFLFVLPLFTMRLFAEERRSGTDELLMTLPIRDIHIVLGKFFAALGAVVILLSLTLTYCLMTDFVVGPNEGFVNALLVLPKFLWAAIKVPFVWLFGSDSLATVLAGSEERAGIFASTHLDPGPIVASYLGLFLAAFAFVALGVFASSVTEHQIVAANIAFAVLLVFWIIGWMQELTDIELIKTVVRSASLNTHLDPFIKGAPDILNIAYFLGVGCYFIFLTWVVIFWTRLGRGFVSVAKKSKLNVLWLVAALGVVGTVNLLLIQGEWTNYTTVGVLLSVGAVAAWFILNTEWLAQLVVSHGFLYTMLLLGLAVFGLVVLCSGLYITDKSLDLMQRKIDGFDRTIDMTKIRKFSLADQSKKILTSMTEPVTLVYIQNPNFPQEQMQVRELFELYANQRSDVVSLQYVDAERTPGIVEDFGVSVAYGDVYVEAGSEGAKRRQKVDRQSNQIEENGVTNGILKVMKLDSPKVYLTTGHGEYDVESKEEKSGLAYLKDQLEKEVYEVESLELFSKSSVPDDAAVVMVVGPKTGFFENELGMLKEYLDRGGNLIVFVEPRTEAGLDPLIKLLDDYGVVINNDLIVDAGLMNRLQGTYARVQTRNYGQHAITDGLETASAFDYARSLELKGSLPNSAEGIELVKSSAEAWGETDLEAVVRGTEIGYQEGEDTAGPVTVAVALSWESEAAVAETDETTDEATGLELNKETPESHLVVYGDADMVSNAWLEQNRNLILNTLAWMSDRQELVSIRPRAEFGQPIMVNPMESRVIWAIGVVDLPMLILLLGIAVMVRRRVRG